MTNFKVNLATPEQREAIKRMEDNMPPKWIFEKVAKEIPQQVPDGTDKTGWKFGSARVIGRIGGFSPDEFVQGHNFDYVNDKRPSLSDADLSDIKYCAFWRQSAHTKRYDEYKKDCDRNIEQVELSQPSEWTEYPVAFAATIPLGFCGKVTPGQDVNIERWIPIGTSNEEIERMARESIVRLQEVVKEYWESK